MTKSFNNQSRNQNQKSTKREIYKTNPNQIYFFNSNIFIKKDNFSLKNPTSNLYEALIPLWPGNYEYKFMLNGNFVWDDYKPQTFDWCRNHFFSLSDHAAKIHQNISAVRAVINNYQKKLPNTYPEIFVETHVKK